MRTASPWWASLAFGVGLVFVFLGERLFGYSPGIRGVMTVIGVVLLVAVTLLRAWTTFASVGQRRNVERTLLLCQAGVLLSLVLYALTTHWGVGHFHWTDKGVARFQTALTVGWTIVLLCSVVPMFMIELSLGTALRTSIDVSSANEEGLEYMRVRDIGWSGLTVALAGSLMMVTCNVATERNVQKDVSYFKTSSPGESTQNILNATGQPIKALLFFPDPNEVKDQVEDYFQALGHATGKVTIEEHDRLVDADLAAKYHVAKDGVIVLVRGTGDKEKSETIEVDTDIERARKGSKLRNFDKEVNSALMKLVRAKRKAYLVTGHGEINDYASVPPELKGRVPERGTTLLRSEIEDIGYEVKNLTLLDLTKDVPDDATVVLLVGPSLPLEQDEWESLGRYLDRGGRLFIALDPKGESSLGPLEGKLGVKMLPGDLTDDRYFARAHHSLADRQWVETNQVSAHASTTTLSRMAADRGVLMIDAGALEDVPTTGPAPKKTVTIHSMDSSWLDLDGNFTFDSSAGEKRERWPIGEAIEGPKLKDKAGKDKDGYRVLVYSDADMFADLILGNGMGMAHEVLPSGPLLIDSVRWLGGEEEFAGQIVSEDDKAIQHTEAQDAKWFTLTIVGAPLLVLGLGLGGTLTRRRRGKKTEVKS